MVTICLNASLISFARHNVDKNPPFAGLTRLEADLLALM